MSEIEFANWLFVLSAFILVVSIWTFRKATEAYQRALGQRAEIDIVLREAERRIAFLEAFQER